MLTPNEIERASMALDEPIKALENQIMQDIVRRIRINSEITRSADWQINRLHELGMSQDDIKKAIADNLNLSNDEINQLYNDIISKGYSHNAKLYSKGYIPAKDNAQLISAIATQTSGELKNISQSLGFAVRLPSGKIKFTHLANYYQSKLDSTILGIANGVFDYNTAIKSVITEMTNSGLRTVDYSTGRSNRVGVAVRRSVMTGLSQLTAKINEDNANALGTDMYEVTWHSGARPSHQEWQGKWYTHAQLVSVCGLGKVDGLCGANCYHDYYPVVSGLSKPAYSAGQLAEMNKAENTPIKYNDKEYTKYEALQRQRLLETQMRADKQTIKLLEDGGADEDDIINAKCRYRGHSQEYARFSKFMGLPQQRARLT